MGVPAMFRWLSQKYPKIVSSVVEELPKKVDDETIPVDRSKPNPNGEEFDNLYLDMNGIVHPCSHPEDRPAPRTEAEMMLAIFEYTDRLVGMVRPRKLLYLAVDGVAPRAKMNQQRARRFRAAQEAKEKDAEREEFQKVLTAQKASRGEDIHSLEEVVEKTWDSNAITPGTPFMHLLAESLQFWAAYKFTTDPSWMEMKVIISDASVPGEGEHKIMNFVRSQRSMPTHDPNTSHVICGLDADLIMLSLATHEPHFRILREDVFFDPGVTCTRCGQKGHKRFMCNVSDLKDVPRPTGDDAVTPSSHLKPHIWLHTNILREYIAVEMDTPQRKFPYDRERALDDWVFMCFFVGNDFLPHLPSLEIRDQGIDLLINIWRDLAANMDDYVTKDGFPDMLRVQQIMTALASREAGIFKKRKEDADRQAERSKARSNKSYRPTDRKDPTPSSAPSFKRHKEDTNTYTNASIVFFDPKDAQSKEVRNVHKDLLYHRDTSANKSAAAKLKELMKAKADDTNVLDADAAPEATREAEIASLSKKRKADEIEDEDKGTPGQSTSTVPDANSQQIVEKKDDTPVDTVKLWEDGYEERYYEQKFHVAPDDIAFRNKVARQYAEGLCWVLAYYMQGCPSWSWYFPHHYAPFAADFVGLEDMDPRKLFEKGEPFHPYEQLMSVLPAASNHAIPKPYRPLMEDADSPIIDFYPEDFPLDLNGKKFAWQGVVILPFIDEKRLLENMALKYSELTEDEKQRNKLGKETLMFSQESRLFHDVEKALYRKNEKDHELNPVKSGALHGQVEIHDWFVLDGQLVPPFDVDENTEFDIIQDGSMRVYYEMPSLAADRAHKSVLLDGVCLPKEALNQYEIRQIRDGRGGRGGRGGGRGGYNDRGGYQNGRGRGGYGDRGGGGYNKGQQGNNHGGHQQQGNYVSPSFSSNWPSTGLPPPPPGWVPPPGFVQPHNTNGGPPSGPPTAAPSWMGNQNPAYRGGPPPQQQRGGHHQNVRQNYGHNNGNHGGYGGGQGRSYNDNPYNDRRHNDRGGGGRRFYNH